MGLEETVYNHVVTMSDPQRVEIKIWKQKWGRERKPGQSKA